MKITAEHHRQMPYLKRLTEDLSTEQDAVLETLLDYVFKEAYSEGFRNGVNQAVSYGGIARKDPTRL